MKSAPLNGKIGSFNFLELIGAGTSGEVYRVRKDDGDVCALKLLYPGFDFQEDPQLEEEIKALRKVDHPNVVRFMGAGEINVSGHSRFYLLMEFIEGQMLREWMEHNSRPPEDIWLPVARALAEAIAALHSNGIIHRDLKPENIKINNDGKVILLDLGLARIQEASLSMSIQKSFIGTLLYASPEQLSERPVRKTSDIFSFGVILYEIICGRHPFYEQGDSLPTLIAKILGKIPRSPRALGIDIQPLNELLVLEMLSRNANDRPSSIEEVIECLEGEKIRSKKTASVMKRGYTAIVGVTKSLEGVSNRSIRPRRIKTSDISKIAVTLGYDDLPWKYIYCQKLNEVQRNILLPYKDKYNKITAYDYYRFSTSDGKYHKLLSGKGHTYITDISQDNSEVIFARASDGLLNLYIMDTRTGNTRRLTKHGAADGAGVFSPDMTRIALDSTRDRTPGVYVMNIDGADIRRVVPLDMACFRPRWMPDGSRLVFERLKDNNRGIWMIDIDTGEMVGLSNSPESEDWLPYVSPDGLVSYIAEPNDGSPRYVSIINPKTMKVIRMPEIPYFIGGAVWTPDGKWLIPCIEDKLGEPWSEKKKVNDETRERFFFNPRTGDMVSVAIPRVWGDLTEFK